ncbi:2-aminoethylphosphonate--pyruvate transaminase [Zobellella endophytica]|uniref:2-aminoethylphosphonate--pyruvate transaminase n=1 Tax=Zobellella endophytica TaxID=2116700 RepID=A0A2P7R2I8_9GAMM|nr:2-aminoethylphosphonate--pyruvate transaminase [Zobellella endophytica]PSJ44436.1 2-aminoethylphosphonate--pyruvate transaminase [Zobellella endophytica]
MNNPYLLLTPGPLSTSATVREVMMKDWCTWDDDYNQGVVQPIRRQLVRLATARPGYTSVLMQGSGTAGVESVLGSAIPAEGKLLVLSNGAYGRRMGDIARCLGLSLATVDVADTEPLSAELLTRALAADPAISHVAFVHCETTTGILNPLAELCQAAKAAGKTLIVDAMSSFGGVPMDVGDLAIDFLISSANKCIQGVPGFCFIIAREASMRQCEGRARSVSLDLFDQWQCMEQQGGKWRFTSPTHVVRAFAQALTELELEGGVAARHHRYQSNQRALVDGMARLGCEPLVARDWQSPIITVFAAPTSPDYDFKRFYIGLKEQGYVIYPGKVSAVDCFRIGTIGEVYQADVAGLLAAIENVIYW